MKAQLARFGVAMESTLLTELDSLVEARSSTRSETLRDLVRAEVSKSQARAHVPAVATLTLVYDHHVRDLTDKLTEIQHELGEAIRSTMHVHLTHDLCLEVIVMKGYADDLHGAANRILGERGVTHGGIEIVPLDVEQSHPHTHGKHHSHEPVATKKRPWSKAKR